MSLLTLGSTILDGVSKVSDFISGLGGLGESIQSSSHSLSPNTWLESVGLGKYTSDYKANAEREDSYFSRLAQSAEDAGYSPQAVLGSSLSNGTSANSSADYTNALGYQTAMNNLALQEENIRSNKIQNDILEYNLGLSKESGLRTTDSGKVAQIVELINGLVDNGGFFAKLFGSTSSSSSSSSSSYSFGDGSLLKKIGQSWKSGTTDENGRSKFPPLAISLFANMFANLFDN